MSRAKAFVMPKLVDEAAERKALETEAAIQSMVEAIYRQLGHGLGCPPALITEVEAAAILHQAPATLQRWRYARSHPLPARKIGGTVLYRPYDVAAFILSRTQGDPR
jgi:hypothetical protein